MGRAPGPPAPLPSPGRLTKHPLLLFAGQGNTWPRASAHEPHPGTARGYCACLVGKERSFASQGEACCIELHHAEHGSAPGQKAPSTGLLRITFINLTCDPQGIGQQAPHPCAHRGAEGHRP